MAIIGRRGAVSMSRTYVVGDIHGMVKKLRILLDRCAEHADGRPMSFVFLGDYIDRGPDTAGVIRLLMEMQSDRPAHVVALMGNHEAMAIDVVDGRAPEDAWLPQGGRETLV